MPQTSARTDSVESDSLNGSFCFPIEGLVAGSSKVASMPEYLLIHEIINDYRGLEKILCHRL